MVIIASGEGGHTPKFYADFSQMVLLGDHTAISKKTHPRCVAKPTARMHAVSSGTTLDPSFSEFDGGILEESKKLAKRPWLTFKLWVDCI